MESRTPQASSASLSGSGEPWLASRLLQRQVVNASTVEPVGRVADLVFDPEACQVTALTVQQTPSVGGLLAAARDRLHRHRAAASVMLNHIIALNGDVVMIDSDPAPLALSAPKGRIARLGDVCELTILTIRGICLGVLADILLDGYGSAVVGYVVKPSRRAEPFLMPLDDLGLSSPPQLESGTGATEGAGASASPSPHLRFIPASPRVRIGDALILVLGEVEPLPQYPTVVTSQPGERAVRAGSQNNVYHR